MTFTELKTAVKDYCNLTSTEADTRVGKAINRHYRRITSKLGMDASRFVTRNASMTVGQQYVTFTEIEKIDRILDVTDATAIRLITEKSIHEIRSTQPGESEPMGWALQNTDADSVVALFDTVPQSAYSLQADGWTTLADLTGTDEPVFPESYHDVLSWFVIAEELLKKEKGQLAATYEIKADNLLRELVHHLADTHTRDTRQGGSATRPSLGVAGGGGNTGGSAYTQTGLITFDRDPSAPFAVTDTSAYVPNLYAEGVGNVTTDRLIGRDTAGTGESEQISLTGGLEFTGSTSIQIADLGVSTAKIAGDAVTFAKIQNLTSDRLVGRDTASSGDAEELTVGGGLEFTGSGGIQRSALTGDVTASAGSGATTIPNDTVTYAKLQNVSAASRLLGRGSASGAGDAEEVTLGTGLSMSGTTLSASSGTLPLAINEGRLTATTGVPVTVSNVAGATSIYYAPYLGNRIALYDGASAWNIRTFTEITIALAGFTASTPYDVFAYDNAGTVTIETLIWTNATTRATALTTQDGVLVKTGATTRRYLGTVYINASGGQTDDTEVKRYLYNADNRVRQHLRVMGSSTWTYTTATFRQANASTGYQVEVMQGWPAEGIEVDVQIQSTQSTGDVDRAVAIGEDSTSTPATGCTFGFTRSESAGSYLQSSARLRTIPAVGRHYYAWLEYSVAAGTTTWYGASGGVLQSGIVGMWSK